MQPNLGEKSLKGAESFSHRTRWICQESTTDDAVHPVKDMNPATSLVQPERAFIHVSLEMLLAELMICAVEHPLQDSPDGFYAVGRSHSIHKYFSTTFLSELYN